MTAHEPTGQKERVQARRAQALALRIAGASFRQIGRQLGVSHVRAIKDVQHELDTLAVQRQESAERLKALELARCDRLTLALEPKVGKGDVQAVRAMVRVMERRARLLGIDAPFKTELTGKDGGPIEVMAQAAEDLGERLHRLAKRLDSGEMITVESVPVPTNGNGNNGDGQP